MSQPAESRVVEAAILDTGGLLTLDALKLRLAAQLAPRGWRPSLEALARRLEHGQPLDAAFDAEQTWLPHQLRCLIREAMRVGDPAKLILDALRARAEINQSWRELLTVFVYPFLLVGVALCVGVAFSYTIRSMVDFEWIEEFGFAGYEQVVARMNDQHHAILGMGMVFLWLSAVMITIATVGPRWAWVAVAGGIVLIGRPIRWISLQEILRRLELFVAQGMPPVDAAAAVSRSFSQGGQAVAAEAIAQRTSSGMPLGRSLSASMLSDGLCRPALLLLDERSGDTPQALLETAELIGRLAERQCRTLANVLPAFVLVLVGTIVWASILNYLIGFMPLMSAINSMI